MENILAYFVQGILLIFVLHLIARSSKSFNEKIELKYGKEKIKKTTNMIMLGLFYLGIILFSYQLIKWRENIYLVCTSGISVIIISEMIRRKLKLLKRLDASGPSKEEVERVARELAGDKEVEYLAKRKTTWSHRLGKWVGRHKGLVRIVDVFDTRVGMFSVTQWLGILVVVVILGTIYYQQTHYTNRIYLKELIESHTIEKAASGIVASARKTESAKGISNDEWKVIEQRLSDCMVKEAKLYLVSDHPYLLEKANKDTPRILSARFMRSCGAIE